MIVRTRLVICGALAVFILLVFALSSSVGLRSAKLHPANGPEQMVTLPSQVQEVGLMTYELQLPVSTSFLSWLPGGESYRIIPDDMLVSLRLNGTELPLDGIPMAERQDYRNGFVIDLRPYLNVRAVSGRSAVLEVTINNSGGPGGLSVLHSWNAAVDFLSWFSLGILLFVGLGGKYLSWERGKRERTLVAWGVLVAGMFLRWTLSSGLTGDYTAFLFPWYQTLHDFGFAAYGRNFSDYAPLYLYLLGIGTSLPLSSMVVIKLISVLGELSLALAAWRLVSLLTEKSKFRFAPWLPLIGFGAVFLLPTALINGAYWGQCDGLYVSAVLWALVYALKKRALPAMIWWGIAISLKLQAVFVGPVFLALIFTNQIRWPWLFAVPVPYLVFTIPSLIAGRPFAELMNIYFAQADTYMRLSMNAPSIHNWFSDGDFPTFNAFGLALAGLSGLVIAWFGARPMFRRAWDPDRIILIALLSSIVIPYFLPRMHERYYFAADVLSVLWAMRFRRDWLIPVAVVSTSFFSYLPFLFGMEPIPFPVLSIVMGTGCVLAARRLVLFNRPVRIPGSRLAYLRGRKSL